MKEERTVLKGDIKGGLLDTLINRGELPTVKIQIEKDTLIQLGIMIVISITIVIFVQAILKQILLK